MDNRKNVRNKNERRDSYKKDYNNQRPRQTPVEEEISEGTVVGRNAVRELLKSGRAIDKIFVQRGEREGSIVVIVAEAIYDRRRKNDQRVY